MSENLLPQTPAIKEWLAQASSQLINTGITSARLDAELILANSLSQSRTYLHAHPEQIINPKQSKLANRNLIKRLKNIPIAYITGHKEFYGRDFMVNKNTLIPRPESEDIIETLKTILSSLQSKLKSKDINLIDVGTGSGCLGITAKLEFNNLKVNLLDISNKALIVATNNAKNLSADVAILNSDLLDSFNETPNIIIANLPYVDKTWHRSPETEYEPALALFASNNGLSIIQRLIVQASNKLSTNGWLIIEADPIQHQSLINFAKKYNFELTSTLNYVITFRIL